MTNRELLKTPSEQLSRLEHQMRNLLQKEMTPVPCPVCKKPVDALTAARIDIDQYDPSKSLYPYRCPDCRAELELVVPLVCFGPGWQWQIKHEWLMAKLKKALAYDRDNQPNDSATECPVQVPA